MIAWMIAALAWAGPDYVADAKAAIAAKEPDRARALLEACLVADPAAAACAWELGWVHWGRNDWQAVADAWRKVEAIDPAYPDLQKFMPHAVGQAQALKAAKAILAQQAARPAATGGTLRIRAVGDIMMGTDFPAGYLPPDAGASAFAGVKPWLLDADLTFGNLEGPLCDGGTTTKCGEGGNCYAFRTPTAYGKWLTDAGFDLASTANNHAEDFGQRCRLQTEETLKKLGIAYSGRPGTTATIEKNGLRIGMIGFHTNPNSHYVNDLESAKSLVAALAATHDIVIVSFHGGGEGRSATHVKAGHEIFLGEDRGDLRAFARTVIAAGADLVLGHGPHVPRGMEIVDGRLVAYSLGNFSTYGRFNLSGDLATSLVLEATLDATGKLVSGKILPVHQDGEGIPVVDATNRAITLIRELDAVDFPQTAPVIADDGTFRPR